MTEFVILRNALTHEYGIDGDVLARRLNAVDARLPDVLATLDRARAYVETHRLLPEAGDRPEEITP